MKSATYTTCTQDKIDFLKILFFVTSWSRFHYSVILKTIHALYIGFHAFTVHAPNNTSMYVLNPTKPISNKKKERATH